MMFIRLLHLASAALRHLTTGQQNKDTPNSYYTSMGASDHNAVPTSNTIQKTVRWKKNASIVYS